MVKHKKQTINLKGIALNVTYNHFITSRNEDFVRVVSVEHKDVDITPLINVLICIDIEKQLIKGLKTND